MLKRYFKRYQTFVKEFRACKKIVKFPKWLRERENNVSER